jgi:hypothetical protein
LREDEAKSNQHDKIDKAIEWCDKKIKEQENILNDGSERNADVKSRAADWYCSYKHFRTYLQQLK